MDKKNGLKTVELLREENRTLTRKLGEIERSTPPYNEHGGPASKTEDKK